VTDRPGSDRFGILVAVLGGLLVALAAVLIIFLVARNDDGATTTAAASTTETTTPDTTGSTAAPTTEAPTTTTLGTTTTPTTTAAPTTTAPPPFTGTLDDKSGPVIGSPSGRVIDIRSADHDGYARVVFDFSPGGVPSYFVGYTDAVTLTVILYPMNDGDPYDPGIFDAGGSHPVNAGEIVSVEDGGMGAGSGEYSFEIVVTAQRPFSVGTLADPPRLYLDVGD
jgi:hypothetical protein